MAERAAIFVRVTHKGVDANGREFKGSITLYDIEDGSISKTTRFVPVPYQQTVDVPLTSQALLSYTSGAIRKQTENGYLDSQVYLELRDISHKGGALGDGAALAAVSNVERVGGTLRLVIPDNAVGSPVAVGFYVNERVEVSGLTGVYAALNGEYTISAASSGVGLAGVSTGHYLIEMPSMGADLPAGSESGVVRLLDGRQSLILSSGLQDGGSFGHLAGIPVDGISTGSGGGGTPTANPSTQTITQAGHGFTVGQALYFDGAVWQLATANSTSTLGTHIVYEVTDASTFLAVQSGFIEGLSGLTPGCYYFVSGSAPGVLVDTDPSIANSLFYSNPIMLAVSATEGWVVPWRASGPNATGHSVFTEFATTDGVPFDAQVVTVPDDSVAYVQTTVVAREVAPNNDSAAFDLRAKVTTTGVVPALSGSTFLFSDGDLGASWGVTYAITGGNVVVQVTGDPTNTVNWKLNTQVYTL